MAPVRARDLRHWLTNVVAETLGVDPAAVSTRAPLTGLGLSSLEGITLARRLGEWLGREVPTTIVWDRPSIEQLVAALTDGIEQDLEPDPHRWSPAVDEHASVACIGLSCRFPGAANEQAYWELLASGGDGVTEVPRDRWDVDAFYDADSHSPGTIASRRGGFLDGLDRFDPGFFGLTPREACVLDPRQRLALEAAWDALEHAGVRPSTLAGTRTGVFMATLSGNFGTTLFTSYLRAVDAYAGSGNGNAVVANRISHVLDLHGPSVAVDTACSGSLVAVHLACESLRRGECDTAIVGGVNVILRPGDSVFFSKTGALAPDGRCKPFDRAANGIVRSEGVGVVVLRRLDDASIGGDRVLALIRGTAVNHGGATNGIMAPSSRAQEAVVRQACEHAGVDPAAVQYVETHGTGTPVGDPIEAAALGRVFGRAAGREAPLVLGSVKGNVGHTEAAAGMAGLIKAVLSVERRALLGTAGFEQPNPLIDFDGLRLQVATSLGPWPRPDRPLLAGVSAFGFSGTNAHVIISEPPTPVVAAAAPELPGPRLILVSGRTRVQLDAHVGAYARFLADAPKDFAAVAAASALHREHLEQRVAVIADSPSAARRSLEAFAAGEVDPGCVHVARPLHRPKLAFVFSGQGSRWRGMGRELIEREPLVRRVIHQCELIVAELGGPKLALLDPVEAEPGSVHDQLEIFAVQIAIAALLRQWGVVPDAVVGQSLGEVAAAHVAGALSLHDALKVVALRSGVMARIAGAGATAVVGLSAAQLRGRLVDVPGLDFAGASSPELGAVSGSPEALDAWLLELEREGVFARRIPGIDVAFHSAQLDGHLDSFRAALADLRPRPARIPFYSTVDATLAGGPIAGETLDGGYWARNLREPFALPPAISAMVADDLELFVEIAPRPLLQQPLRGCLDRRDGLAPVLSTLEHDADGQRCMQRTLAQLYVWGAAIDWGARYPEPAPEVRLPRTIWQRERHWFDQLPHARVPSGFDCVTGRPWSGELRGLGHPLLGSRLELAGVARERVWSHELSDGAPAWLRDHGVGGQVLIPAAAMLAMAIAAAEELVEAETIEIVDLTIERPLAVPAEATVSIQARAAAQGDGRWAWALFYRGPLETGWVRCAHAVLGAGAGLSEGAGEAEPPVAAVRVPIEEHFARMAADGLEYGPSFRALRALAVVKAKVWAELELGGEARSDLDAYAIHPALIDGAIQATRHLSIQATRHLSIQATRHLLRSSESEDPPRLPVGFARVRCGRASSSPSAVRCEVVGGGAVGADGLLRAGITLRTDDGATLLTIEGLQLRAIAGGHEHRPRTPEQLGFGLRWIEQAARRRSTGGDGPSAPGFGEDLLQRIDGWSETFEIEHYARQQPILEALATRYVIAALDTLGWRPREGEVHELEGLAVELGVAANHRRFLRRLLQMLEQDGALAQAEGRADAWVVRDGFGDRWGHGDIAPLVEQMRSQFPASVAELGLLRRVGESLATILTGEVEALTRLFPSPDDHLLRTLYSDTAVMQVYNRIAAEAVAAMLPEREGAALRVIEIGAGTGATTSHVLDRLPATGVEYTITDVSTLLARQTGADFEADPRVSVRSLDIERSPGEQGFAPGSQDVVVAANVLHATRDLGESLAHVRELLAPDGLLVLLEGARAQRWLDVVVGGTEGWWRFADARQDHPLLDAARWREALTRAGFAAVDRYVDPNDSFGQLVMLARAPARVRAPRRWVLLGDRRGVSKQLERALAGRGDAVSVIADPSRLAAELQATQLEGEEELGIVHTGALDLPGDLSISTADDLDRVERELERLRDVARALVGSGGGAGRRTKLWVATAGVHEVPGRARAEGALRGPIWGLVRSLFLEHQAATGALVDLDPGFERDPEAAAVRLLCEVDETSGEDQVAWRGSTRFVARLVREAGLKPRGPLRLRADATYLVTGGTRGIGLATARWLVLRGARRLALMARTSLPARGRWDDPDLADALVSRIAAVRELEGLGAAVRVLCADLGDEQAVAAALDRLEHEGWPAVRGVVHSAGLIDDHLLVNLEGPALRRVLRPKLRGPWLLDRRFADSLDFFVLFSSGTSLIGGTLGQANYAAGNAFLDALARDRARRGVPATTINWGIWGGAGIIERSELGDQLARTGLLPITEAEGIAALELAVQSGVAQLGVVAMNHDVWSRLPGLSASPYYSLIADGPAPVQAVEGALDGLAGPQLRERLRGLVGAMVAEVTMQDPAAIGYRLALGTVGLDSIMAVELKHRLDGTFGVTTSVVDLLRGATVESIVETLAVARETAAPVSVGPTPRPAVGVRAASSVQLGFWSLQQRAPHSPVYGLPILVHLGRRIAGATFEAVIAALVQRHAILRTALVVVDGRLAQRVLDHASATVGVVDLAALAPAEADAVLEREARSWARQVFDLGVPPLIRCTLFQLRERSVCLFNLHHAVVDGWSASIVVREFEALYAAFEAGAPDPLPAPTLSYADYVDWQQDRLDRGELEDQLGYWRDRLASPPAPLFVPITPAAERGFPGRQQRVEVEAEVVRGLERVCQATGATMFMSLLAGLCAVLGRTHGRDAMTVGAARSNRDRPELRDVLGCYVNMLAVQVAIDPAASFVTLVEAVRDATMEAFSNCDVPFEHALRAANVTQPFEVVFVFKTTPTWLPAVVTRVEQLDTGVCKYPLSLDLTRNGDALEGFFEYDTDRFTIEEAAALARLLGASLRAAIADPHRPLAAILDAASRDPLYAPSRQESTRYDASERFGF